MKDLIISICALFLSIISLAISIYFNKKSLKQAEKLVYAQLTYKDMKIIFDKVLHICKSEKTAHTMRDKIRKIFYSYEGSLLPQEFKSYLYEQFDKIEKLEKSAPWYEEPQDFTKEDSEDMDNEYKSLNDMDKYEYDQLVLINSIKSGVENKISNIFKKYKK